MPRRWLSKRGRQSNDPSPAQNTGTRSGTANSDFDFPFQREAISPTERATATNGVDCRRKKRPSNDASAAPAAVSATTTTTTAADLRPQTSDVHRAAFNPLCHRPTESVSNEQLIGIAYGSPSHPPLTARSFTAQMSPDSPGHSLGHHEPMQNRERRIFPRSWKKIGSLFTSKHPTAKANESSVSPYQSPYQHIQASKSDEILSKQSWLKYKVQIQEPPTTDPPPPPPRDEGKTDIDQVSSTQEEDTKRLSSYNGKTVLLDPSPSSSPYIGAEDERPVRQHTRSATLPKLEISIPSQSGGIDDSWMKPAPAAAASSSLLQRRSRTATSLRSGSSDSNVVPKPDKKLSPETAEADTSNLLQTRYIPDISLPKPEFVLKPSSSSPTLRKYSLFPPPSPVGPDKSTGQIQQISPLKRSLTSPSHTSPMRSNFPTNKPEPLANSTKSSTNQDVTSPALNTASTETTNLWSAIPSQGSSLSSNTDEIFFDVKSFRDSRGVEDGKHFVMSRPDSAVVELARSISRLKLSASKEPTNKSSPLAKKEENAAVASDDSITTATTVYKFSLPSARPEVPREANASSEEKATTSMVKPPPADTFIRTQNKGQTDLNSAKFTVPSPIVEELSPGLAIALVPEQSRTNSASSARPVLSGPQQMPQLLPVQALPKEVRQDSPSSPKATMTAKSVSNLSNETKAVPNSSSTIPVSQPAPKSSKADPPQVRAIKRIDHPIQESPTIPQSPPLRMYPPVAAIASLMNNDQPPPPVPQKDTKYIPISKYAPKKTLSKIESVGFRPARLDRAATDSFVSKTDQLAKSSRERSATIPVPRTGSGLRIQNGQDLARERMTPSPSQVNRQPSPSGSATVVGTQTGNKAILHPVTTVVQAALTAEVSVARTVSLTRKQSSKVVVPGPKLAARRKQMTEEAEGKGKVVLAGSEMKSSAVNRLMIDGARSSGQRNEKQQQQIGSSNSILPLSSRPPGSGHGSGSGSGHNGTTTSSTLTNISPNVRPPAGISAKALSNLNPLASHPMDSQSSLVSQTSQVSQFSYQSEVSTLSKAQKKADRELVDKFQARAQGRKEVHEGMRMSPVIVVEGQKGHKPGASVGIVLDTA